MDDTTTVNRQILITIVNFVSQTIYSLHYHPYTHFLQQIHYHLSVLAWHAYSASLAQTVSSEIATVKLEWWFWRSIVAEGPEAMCRCVLASLQHADKKSCLVGDFMGKINTGREHPPMIRCNLYHMAERMRNYSVSGWTVLSILSSQEKEVFKRMQ